MERLTATSLLSQNLWGQQNVIQQWPDDGNCFCRHLRISFLRNGKHFNNVIIIIQLPILAEDDVSENSNPVKTQEKKPQISRGLSTTKHSDGRLMIWARLGTLQSTSWSQTPHYNKVLGCQMWGDPWNGWSLFDTETITGKLTQGGRYKKVRNRTPDEE